MQRFMLAQLLTSLRENQATPAETYLRLIGLAEPDFEREFDRFVRARYAV
jgi:hypothetical protein